ncbi:hypothetical protein L228DRAFT_115751 [Xylona heveae TC161]|uniref:RING-type E3 ubiquitin transferase n=1 Tax=Xylona heveae (strain CBS 132557 / TC161) TaxID=1328760 RepID=A0A165HF63_XYLHT|nr:hypothetical protein L228DRAFT_115751 [Xylona heveae TC161]KZF23419.1 hypothetical protein L228DRAFT_115751 [Xylona heveae TC161]
MGPGTQNNPLLQNFQTMLQGMMGPQFARNQPATQQGGPQAHPQAGAGAGSNDGQQPGHREGDGAHNPQQQHQWQGVHQAPGIRIGYNARLYPRDANNPQPQQEPFGGLQDVLGALFQQINDASQPQAGGGNGPGAGPANPLAAILASMFNPAAAAHGDAVYTQEALDRVISQLMEQNATGNAPGPATEEAIAALPKKKVDQSMLDESTGTADCSICMDPVEIGSDVTVLPCRHWFHEQCIGAWLGEHDTCPHCRKGIMPKEGEGEGNGHGQGAVRTPGQEPANSQPSATSPWPEAAPPEGSRTNPISIGSETGSPPPPAPASVPGIQRHGSVPATEHASGSGEGHSGGGGLGSRVRGWFSGSNHSQSP